MKKIIVAILACIIVFELSACSEKTTSNQPSQPSESSSGQNSESSNPSSTPSESDLQNPNQTLNFIGHTISYPSDGIVGNSDYGKSIDFGSEYFLLFESPAAAGKSFTVNDLDEAVSSCEPYIYSSLESKLSFLFTSGNTKQNVKSTSDETVNGIKMKKVVGTFLNVYTNQEINYAGYYFVSDVMSYFLSESEGTVYPVYIICIDFGANNTSVEDFIDSIIASITRS